MRYKYPKSIVIGNTKFKIKYDKKKGGARFTFGDEKIPATITFGMLYIKKDQEFFLTILIHELSEIVHVILTQRFRYQDNDTNYLFSYDHRGFDTHCQILAGALNNFIV